MGCIIILFITLKRTLPVTEQEAVGRGSRYQPLLARPHKRRRGRCPRTLQACEGHGGGLLSPPLQAAPQAAETSPSTRRHAKGCRTKPDATSLPLWQKGPAAPRPAPGELGKGGRHASGPPAPSTPAPSTRCPHDRRRQSRTEGRHACPRQGSTCFCQRLPPSGSTFRAAITAPLAAFLHLDKTSRQEKRMDLGSRTHNCNQIVEKP